MGYLQRSKGVRFWETSQRHGIPLLLSESGWLRGRRARHTWRRAWAQTPTAFSSTPPTAPVSLHTWQKCKYPSQTIRIRSSINWCKCHLMVFCFSIFKDSQGSWLVKNCLGNVKIVGFAFTLSPYRDGSWKVLRRSRFWPSQPCTRLLWKSLTWSSVCLLISLPFNRSTVLAEEPSLSGQCSFFIATVAAVATPPPTASVP